MTTCLNDYCKSKRGNNFQFPNTSWLNLITHTKEEELKRLTSVDTGTKDFQDKYEYIETIINNLSIIKDKMETIIREKLEEKMWSVFKNILPDTEYKGVEISESYAIRLKYKNNEKDSWHTPFHGYSSLL